MAADPTPGRDVVYKTIADAPLLNEYARHAIPVCASSEYQLYRHSKEEPHRTIAALAFDLLRYEKTLVAAESDLARARAEAEAYKRGWKPFSDDEFHPDVKWYGWEYHNGGRRRELVCSDDQLVSHLASLAHQETP